MMIIMIWEEEMEVLEEHNKEAEVSLIIGMMETWKR